MSKRYVVKDNWAVCTDGQIQQGIVVDSQTTIFAGPQKKLVATKKDRMEGNFNCAKLIGAAALVGTIVGAAAGAFLGVGLGVAIGSRFGLIGSVVGGIVGGVAGALTGAITGSVVASVAVRKGMNMFLPSFCSLLTKPFPWSSVHERVYIEGTPALMPDAKVPCLLLGLVSLAIPDMDEAIRAAYASMFMYCDKNEDEVRPEGTKMPNFIEDLLGIGEFYDSDGDNYGGQSYADFEKYNPEQFGWKEVNAEFAASIADEADVPYERYVITDKDGNQYEHHYFYDNESGTKTALYETPEGDYVLVSRGTHNHEEGRSTRDWFDDNKQGLDGKSKQYDDDAKIARATRKKIGSDKRLVTTGHSMAGGKTTLSAATGKSDTSYAFNPAGVHPAMYGKYGVSAKEAARNTYVFSSKNDFLTNMNDNVFIAPNHVGKRIVLDTGSGLLDLTDSHDMILLIEAMKQYHNVDVFANED